MTKPRCDLHGDLRCSILSLDPDKLYITGDSLLAGTFDIELAFGIAASSSK
jgi:hypothetical protein